MIWLIVIVVFVVAAFVAARSRKIRPASRLRVRAPVLQQPCGIRDGFLAPDEESAAVKTGADGALNIELAVDGDQMYLTVPEGRINFRSRTLHRQGIFVFKPRGTTHYAGAYSSLSLRPGGVLELSREPDNVHDPNAVALRAAPGAHPFGYVNKLNAARIAKILDAGDPLVAVSLSKKEAGGGAALPFVLVAAPAVIDRLFKR